MATGQKKRTSALLKVINSKLTTGNPVADRKLELVLEGLPNNTKYEFLTEFPDDNRFILAEFLSDFVIRENVATAKS